MEYQINWVFYGDDLHTRIYKINGSDHQDETAGGPGSSHMRESHARIQIQTRETEKKVFSVCHEEHVQIAILKIRTNHTKFKKLQIIWRIHCTHLLAVQIVC